MIFDIARSPDHMWHLRLKTVDRFGYDQSGENLYRFNGQGYRANVDYDFSKPCLVTVGPSISFGIGIPAEKTFSFLLAQSLILDDYNFSVGCMRHTSYDYFGLLKQLAEKPNIRAMIINWNCLSRVRTDQGIQDDHDKSACVARLRNFLDLASEIVSVPCLHTLFDPDLTDLPLELQRRLLIYNKGVIDYSHCCTDYPAFGVKTNQFIYRTLSSKIREFYHGG